MKQRLLYSIMAGGGVLGVLAASLQTIEKIKLLDNKDAALLCNINSIFNCSTVLSAWQSSVFGFPNSVLCTVLFVIFMTTGFVGMWSPQLARGVRLTIHGLSLFTLVFALWFLWQSTYVIGALCLLCLFCFGGLIIVNAAWLRINAADMPIGARGRGWLKDALEGYVDILVWLVLAVGIAAAMIARFVA